MTTRRITPADGRDRIALRKARRRLGVTQFGRSARRDDDDMILSFRQPAKLLRRKPLKHDILTLRRRAPVKRKARGAMTVCIAAFAENGRAIVLLAGRSISMVRGGQTVLKAESGAQKIRPLCDGWAGLIAGPLDFGERVFSIAEDAYRISAKHEISTGMPECVKLAFQSCRTVEVTDRILNPRLVDRAWYERKLSGKAHWEDTFFHDIAEDIKNFATESALLVCGFENRVPQIYLVCDPGVLHSEAPAGFGIAGVGEDAAKSRLFTLETDPSDRLIKVLYDAYDAKESCAELLPEVGHEWDALILVEGGNSTVVSNEIQIVIEGLHKGHSKSPFDNRSSRPRDWRNRLNVFAKTALGDAEPVATEPDVQYLQRTKDAS